VVKDGFSARVDDVFFHHLFDHADASDAEANLAFERTLFALAQQELEKAIERCVVPDAQRLRAISEAEGLLRGCARKWFPDVFEKGESSEGATS
jgi:hypothetical protein